MIFKTCPYTSILLSSSFSAYQRVLNVASLLLVCSVPDQFSEAKRDNKNCLYKKIFNQNLYFG